MTSQESPSGPPIRIQGPEVERPSQVLSSRPTLALLTLVALGAALELIPGLEQVRLFRPGLPEAPALGEIAAPAAALSVGESLLSRESENAAQLAQPEHVDLQAPARGPIAPQQLDAPALDLERPPVSLVDAERRGLTAFYQRLARTEAREPHAITRIEHFGDSIITSDYVSGTLRRKLQDRFGDAGHGFLLMASAWPAYFHNDVYRFASAGFSVSRIVGPLSPDGLYGLGGVSFTAPPGSRARFGTAKAGSRGRAVSRFIVAYLKRPGGGKLRINLDGAEQATLDTSSDVTEVAYHEVRAPDGEHELEVMTIAGTTRSFGVVLEREGPGVVLDAIGVQGARVRFLDKQDDAHWAEQLRWRDPALLVYQFGANESGDGFAYPMAEYRKTLEEVLAQGLRAVPRAGCLVVGAMDRAEKKGTALQTMAVIPALVAEQRAASAAVGCAFFDTFAAMGGSGSMAAWVQRGLGQGDLTHPTGSGSEVLASWLYRALLEGYEGWKGAGRPSAPPLPEPSVSASPTAPAPASATP